MEVSGQLLALAALPQWKEPLVRTGQEAGWSSETVWRRWLRQENLFLPGIETRSSNPLPSRYTELSRLYCLSVASIKIPCDAFLALSVTKK